MYTMLMLLRGARERAHTFFELCMPNYVGTQLEILTIKIYVYIYDIYNIDYIDYVDYMYIDCVDCTSLL